MKIKMTMWVKVKHNYLGEATYYTGGLLKGDAPLVKLLNMYKPEWNTGYHPDPIYNYAEYLCKEILGLEIIDFKQEEQEYPDNTIF